MNRLIRLLPVLSIIGLLLLIGCGGSGGGGATGTGTAPDALTRTGVKSSISLSMVGIAQSGASNSMGVSGTSGGSGSTIPFVGMFAQGRLPTPLALSKRGPGASGGTTGSTGGSTGGTNGGDGGTPPTFYFDEGMGLWVDLVFNGTTRISNLYEDQAKTKPAGNFTTTISTDGLTFTSTYEITAGSYAGAKGRYESTISPDGSGKTSYSNTWPIYGTSSGECTFGPNGTTWKSRNETPDGQWQESEGSWSTTGEGTWITSDSKGYKFTFQNKADGSGNALIEGPDKGLPATIVWNSKGEGVITWADGSTETFNMYATVSSETGTSGGDAGTGTTGTSNRS